MESTGRGASFATRRDALTGRIRSLGRYGFARASEEPYRRRPLDAIALVLGTLVVAVLAERHNNPTDFESRIFTAINGLPDESRGRRQGGLPARDALGAGDHRRRRAPGPAVAPHPRPVPRRVPRLAGRPHPRADPRQRVVLGFRRRHRAGPQHPGQPVPPDPDRGRHRGGGRGLALPRPPRPVAGIPRRGRDGPDRHVPGHRVAQRRRRRHRDRRRRRRTGAPRLRVARWPPDDPAGRARARLTGCRCRAPRARTGADPRAHAHARRGSAGSAHGHGARARRA